MSEFKVGDKLVRTKGDFRFLREGDICLVTGLKPNGKLEIDDDVDYCYSPDNFELYVTRGLTEVLTPLQAAEAILNEDKLQVYDTDCSKWYTFSCGHRNITIEDLKHIKLRLKPKTIVINGVEVPAPAKKGNIEHYFYIVNFSEGIVNTIDKMYISNNFKHYWATEEDAQKVLDAMLIPFNKS